MAPPALPYLFCTQADVEFTLSSFGLTVRLDDDGDGAVSPAEAAFTQAALNWATEKVLTYLQPRYAAADLANSWLVNYWTSVLAAWLICGRRLNPRPDSIKEEVEGDGTGAHRGVLGELEDVKSGRLSLAVASRNLESPAASNIIVSPLYLFKQMRVQRLLQEQAQHPQNLDWPSETSLEY